MRKKPLKARIRRKAVSVILTAFTAVCALLFLFPTAVTIANSFMTQKEINANYGAMISNFDKNSSKS